MLNGEKLRLIRILRNIKQQDVADACNVSRNFISMAEHNKRIPSQELYSKWINFLNNKTNVQKALKEIKKTQEKLK